MDIHFGAAVFGIAGKKLGDVDGVVIDAGTKRVRAIVVDAGFLNQTRHMIEVSAIQTSDDAGLHLDSTGAKAKADSEVIASEEVAMPERVEAPEVFIPAAGVGGPIVATDPTVPGQYPGDTSFFDMAPIDPPPVEVFSNLLVNEVLLGKRSEAYASDNEKVGRISGFAVGNFGVVETVTVSEGLFVKEHTTFPLADIAEFGTDAVHLRLSKAEAESR